MLINETLNHLLEYGLKTNLIKPEDEIYARNKLLAVLKLTNFEKIVVNSTLEISEILANIDEYAIENNLVEGSDVTYLDIFETEIMDCLMPRPSEVNNVFKALLRRNGRYATKYFYNLSKNSNYIRMDRINKNLVWKTSTEYGYLDITINLSKPEKDPKMIAKLKNLPSENYPKCALCYENVGFAGSLSQAPRQNHRVIEFNINNEQWFFQYSPYVYYNEHCILLKGEHVPMKISDETFKRLLGFVKILPHYFLGSNADLPIVGGSILSHDHFQGGNYQFAFSNAAVLKKYQIEKFSNVQVEYLKWPLDTIRLTASSDLEITELASLILKTWRNYSDDSIKLNAYTDDVPHNTITPIARTISVNDQLFYQLDLVLRNNRTDEEHPDGIFHPHQKLHHIKKENIGLIEVMGLAVLPARLKQELSDLKDIFLNKQSIDNLNLPSLKKHQEWFYELKDKYPNLGDSEAKITQILQYEVGLKFKEVLECCSVFRYGDKIQAMDQFIKRVIDANLENENI